MNRTDVQRMLEEARQVDAAHESREAEAESEQAELLERRKQAARELGPMIEAEFRTVADASDGALRYTPISSPPGEVIYLLSWEKPLPRRMISIGVDTWKGVVTYGLYKDWRGNNQRTVDPTRFTEIHVRQLVEALGQQTSWMNGSGPMVSL